MKTLTVLRSALHNAFFVLLYTFDAENRDQQYAIDLVKEWKAKQYSYINVLVGLKQQQVEFHASKIKQKLVNIQDALDSASSVLNDLEINEDVFDHMSVEKRKDLIKALSKELELGHLVTLTDNSQKILGENSYQMINSHTEASYGEELYFRQSTFNFSLGHQLDFNSRPGSFQQYKTNMNITRIRNRIVAGTSHVLVLMPNGKLYSTGVYNSGNLGRTSQNSRLFYNNPVEGIDGLEILQIEAHRHSSMVLTTKGLYTFGLNDRSQLATGGTKNLLIPTFVNGFNFGTRIIQIASGFFASYAIDETGKLWAWGCNDQGQLGDRTWDEKNRPFTVYRYGVLANQTVVQVCGGNGSALALTSNGRLVAFGDNTYGQLGTSNLVSTGEPVLVNTSSLHNEKITDIQCGMFHNLVLTASGKVFAFGRNNFGQIGDNTNANVNAPKRVLGFDCPVTKIHTKGHVNFAVCESKPGFFYSWGLNDIGQAGVGSFVNVLSPRLIRYSAHPIVDIASNEDYSFLFLADGSIHAVGSCFNTALFFNQECLDLNPQYSTGPLKRYGFSSNGLFVQVRLQNAMHLQWYQRKPVYFDMGDIGYMFKVEDTLPTRRNNGFNLYTTNITTNDMVWSIVEYNETTNTGFPHSIHNTHVLKNGEYIYMFGGVVDDEISNRIYRAPIWDLVKSWEVINETLPVPLASGMIMTVGDYVYIFGGIISIYEFNSTVDLGPTVRHNVTNGIMRAPVSNVTNWEIVKDVIPSPLHSAFIEIVDNYVYLFGGSSTVYGSGINIYRATLQTPTVWEMTFGLLPYYMSNTGPISSTRDTIYIFGGSNSSSSTTGPYFALGRKKEIVGSWTAIPDTNIELNIIRNTQFNWCLKYPLLCYQCSNHRYEFSNLTGHNGPQHFEATNPQVCSSAGVCVDNDVCQCTPGRFGSRCEETGILAISNVRRYADGTIAPSCQSYRNPTNTSRVYNGTVGSGWYWVQIDSTTVPIRVYCDMVTDGGGWMAYYTANNAHIVNLGMGTNNPIDFRTSGYIVDLRRYSFRGVMFFDGSNNHRFTTNSTVRVANHVRNDGTISVWSDHFGGTWSGSLGTYRMYVADRAWISTDNLNSAAFVMVNSVSNIGPSTVVSSALSGFRTNAGGWLRLSSTQSSGLCFNQAVWDDCSSTTTTTMTVFIR